ncbi:hypothetical protein D3C77_583720 [compost metagenome]
MLLAAKARQLLIDPLPLTRTVHAPAQQRVQRKRQQRGLMPPVFEEFALTVAAPGQLIKQRLWITAKTGKQRKVVGAYQGIDRVDLHHPQAFDHPLQLRGPHRRACLASVEALCRQRQAARLGQGKGLCGGHARLLVNKPTYTSRGTSMMRLIFSVDPPRMAAPPRAGYPPD